MTADYQFRTVDFRPAPPGWRIAYATSDGPRTEPMPGWLIREEVECDTHTGDVIKRTGSREVVAAQIVESEASPVYDDHKFWCLLGPGESAPTPQEAADEMARRNVAVLPCWCGKCGLDSATITGSETPAAKFNHRFRLLDGDPCPACHPSAAVAS